LKKKIIIKWIL